MLCCLVAEPNALFVFGVVTAAGMLILTEVLRVVDSSGVGAATLCKLCVMIRLVVPGSMGGRMVVVLKVHVGEVTKLGLTNGSAVFFADFGVCSWVLELWIVDCL